MMTFLLSTLFSIITGLFFYHRGYKHGKEKGRYDGYPVDGNEAK